MGSIRSDGVVGTFDLTEVLDDADLAERRQAEHLAISLMEQHARARAPGALALRGQCLYCAQRCSPLAVYCDADCRDGHEAEQRALQRQGRAT